MLILRNQYRRLQSIWRRPPPQTTGFDDKFKAAFMVCVTIFVILIWIENIIQSFKKLIDFLGINLYISKAKGLTNKYIVENYYDARSNWKKQQVKGKSWFKRSNNQKNSVVRPTQSPIDYEADYARWQEKGFKEGF